MFNNQSLAKVLNELSGLYNVKIIYNRKDIRNIYLTGKYGKTDSINLILEGIARLNNLTIVRNDTAFVISKQSK